MIKSRPARAAAVVVGIIALCAVWALRQEPRPQPEEGMASGRGRVRTTPDTLAALFVGDRACSGCHPRESRDHAASFHAQTLRPVRPDRLPRGFPEQDRFADPHTGFTYTLSQAFGRYTFTSLSGPRPRSHDLDYALGSGKTAMTFVSIDGPRSILELRMTYFPRWRDWVVTPGQQGPESDPLGARHEGERAQRCLACHATVLPESRLAPEERFMGVGCEACHGPGKAHVEAASAGSLPGEITGFKGWGAKRLNEACGDCHRTPGDIDPENLVASGQTQRFQPYGLMLSKCFRESSDRLSCLTCHDPHRNADTTPARYERACRSCHSPGKTVCPVNPKNDCVKCHMPRRELMPHIAMADHWIRVFR